MANFRAVSSLPTQRLVVGLFLLCASASLVAGDMPPLLSNLGTTLLVLCIPSLVLVPVFLVRAAIVGFRELSPAPGDACCVRARSRKWLIWTLVSLVPWVLVGLRAYYVLTYHRPF